MDLTNLGLLPKIESLAKTRGMKPTKAATRLGLKPQEAEAAAAALEVEFLQGEEELVSAYRDIGQSCMTRDPDRVRYWARAVREDGSCPVGIATLRGSRCLVLFDSREYVRAYGEESGLLTAALKFLGYREATAASLEGLTMPEKVTVSMSQTMETVTVRKARIVKGWRRLTVKHGPEKDRVLLLPETQLEWFYAREKRFSRPFRDVDPPWIDPLGKTQILGR